MINFRLRMFAFYYALCLFGVTVSFSQQDPYTIRVEPGRVIVPAAWFGRMQCGDGCSWDDEKVRVLVLPEVQRTATPFSVGILSPEKFQLFEDGKPQSIESFHLVTPGDIQLWLDNLGAHTEAALGQNGIWSTGDYNPDSLRNARSSHQFLISYSPPPSPAGSCHAITLKVPHRSHMIYAKEYCSPPSPTANTPLSTSEESKLDGYLSSGKQGTIQPTVQATAFYETPGQARVNVDIEFPFNEVKPKSWKDGTLARSLLIMAYTKSGQVAVRISEQVPADPVFDWLNDLESLKVADEVVTSTRYDAQMDLPPGEYRLALIYEHGQDFGVTTTPLKVDPYDGSKFGISSIAICKRVRDAGDVPVASEFVPLVAGKYEFTPAGDTVFRKGDSLMAYFELYEPTATSLQQALHVNYTVQIFNQQTGALMLKSTESADSWVVPGKSTIPIAVEPVLSKLNLTPGQYNFQIQATDSAGRSTPIRTAEFSIE